MVTHVMNVINSLSRSDKMGSLLFLVVVIFSIAEIINAIRLKPSGWEFRVRLITMYLLLSVALLVVWFCLWEL